MKILVLGANGMLGHVVSLFLKEKGYAITGLAKNKNPFFEVIVCDAQDLGSLSEVINSGKFDYVINCLALLVKDSEEMKDNAIFINSYLPHYLARLLKGMKTKLIHISTDSVFSGDKGSDYIEVDRKDSNRFYDMTKSLGEVDYGGHITIRASVIGFESKKYGNSLMNWFLRQKEDVYGYDNVIWSGVTAVEYAKCIEKIINSDLEGIYHLSNNYGISKGDLLRLINKYIKKNKVMVNSDKKVKLQRVLINTSNEYKICVSSYEQMILEQLDWINNHKDYYKYFYGEEISELVFSPENINMM